MNKDFLFNLVAGFLFVILICGSIVLADYVFFEGELLKKTERSNGGLQDQVRIMQNENKKLQIELGMAMQNLAAFQKNAAMVNDVAVLESNMLRTALHTPENAFLSHLHQAIGDTYPGIELIEGKFIFKDDIFFTSASAFLSPKAQEVLNQVALSIKALEQKISPEANWVIKVMGHADARRLKSRKPFSSNWILASARAVTIVQYLISRGVNPARLYAAGFSVHQAHQSKNTKGTVKAKCHAVISFDRRVGDA